MGRRDAKSGITLNIKTLLGSRSVPIAETDSLQAIGPPRAKIDFNVFQIREDLRQQRVRFRAAKIVQWLFKKLVALPKADGFLCETAVIYHRADITKKPRARIDPPNKLAGERFCRDLIRISNQRFLINFWFQIIEKIHHRPTAIWLLLLLPIAVRKFAPTVTDLNHW